MDASFWNNRTGHAPTKARRKCCSEVTAWYHNGRGGVCTITESLDNSRGPEIGFSTAEKRRLKATSWIPYGGAVTGSDTSPFLQRIQLNEHGPFTRMENQEYPAISSAHRRHRTQMDSLDKSTGPGIGNGRRDRFSYPSYLPSTDPDGYKNRSLYDNVDPSILEEYAGDEGPERRSCFDFVRRSFPGDYSNLPNNTAAQDGDPSSARFPSGGSSSRRLKAMSWSPSKRDNEMSPLLREVYCIENVPLTETKASRGTNPASDTDAYKNRSLYDNVDPAELEEFAEEEDISCFGRLGCGWRTFPRSARKSGNRTSSSFSEMISPLQRIASQCPCKSKSGSLAVSHAESSRSLMRSASTDDMFLQHLEPCSAVWYTNVAEGISEVTVIFSVGHKKVPASNLISVGVNTKADLQFGSGVGVGVGVAACSLIAKRFFLSRSINYTSK